MLLVSIVSSHSISNLLTSPVPPAGKMMDKLGPDNASLLLHHAAAQVIRSATLSWEQIQILLAVILGGCLYLATQRRLFPIMLCGVMLALVLFQHIGISPELAYRGVQTDFPPGNADVNIKVRFLAMQEIYYAAEIMKLVAGGILASYLFVFRSSRRRKDVDEMDENRRAARRAS